MDKETLLNTLKTNPQLFWHEFNNLPGNFDLEWHYLQVIYASNADIPANCIVRYQMIIEKAYDLVTSQEISYNEKQNLIIEALKGQRDIYAFINIKSHNHYLFAMRFGDVTKDLSFFINKLSLDILNNMNVKHFHSFYTKLLNKGFNHTDATKLSIQVYHVLGYFKGRDLLDDKYGEITKRKLKNIFGSIELNDVLYDLNSKEPILNNQIINLLLGESYNVTGTPIKEYIRNTASPEVNYFVENLNLVIGNWNLILDEYTRRSHLEVLSLRLNIAQIHSILTTILSTKQEIKKKESFRSRKKSRYNKIPGFELRDMPLLDSDVFDYIGTVGKYVTSQTKAPARALELSRAMEGNTTKKFPSIKLTEDNYKLFVFHPQDRDLISAGFRIDCCFVPTGEADAQGLNPSFVEYCLTNPYGGGMEIRNYIGNSVMFSPLLRNGNVLLIHSVQLANYSKEEITIIINMLKKWAREVLAISQKMEGDAGLVAVTITNRGNLPAEAFSDTLPEDKKFHLYDIAQRYSNTYIDLDQPNQVVALKDGATIADIKYDIPVSYNYSYPLSDLEKNHRTVIITAEQMPIVKDMRDLTLMIANYAEARKFMLKQQPALANELLRQIRDLKNRFSEKYQQLFAVSPNTRIDSYKEYDDALNTIKEICQETSANIDFGDTPLSEIYYTDNWFIALDSTGKLYYDCINGSEYQFLIVLEDIKNHQLAVGGSR